MRLCDVCGNEIPVRVTRCPYCESPQRQPSSGRTAAHAPTAGRRPRAAAGRERGARTSPAGSVAQINLKAGMPLVADALRTLELQLAAHRTRGTRVLLVVHGYGSSGAGGAIRGAARKQLRALLGRGQLRSVLNGEEYTEFEAAARELRTRYPQLEATFRTDRANPGITLVEL